ncbi:LysR substrate-binding domain-containing protein [Microbacterium sp.]|uniref:LysR substrate-binding domain-containing protein n=1 Tax=Microbacterium sp. TaxID=51671 RepID=UPI002B953DD9|nr:LysR substrate-binding domain-containing protein [Microbacterium sp.]HWK77744.1 LysR substrate-binding domain-containing protein [Microbacterium sp.]
MELRRIRYFIAVAEELNFSRAAERLHIAQPPLSTQIKQLEQELGVTLFERTSRGVLLTHAGQTLLADARRIVPQLDHAFDVTRRAGHGPTERLTIGFIPSAMNVELPRLLRSYSDTHPNVSVFLRELPSHSVLQGLVSNELDLGLIYLPLDDAAIETKPLRRERIVLAVPDFHHLAARSSAALTEIASEPLVSPDRDQVSGLHDTVLKACRNAGFEPRTVHSDVWLQQTMLGLVAGGLGVALVPDSAINLGRRGVVFLPLRDVGIEVELGFAWQRGHLGSAAASFAA